MDEYENEAFPKTYTDICGDWIGAFAWSQHSGEPWTPVQKILPDQS